MAQTETTEVEARRQRLEPLHQLLVQLRLPADLAQKLNVLPFVLGIVGAKIAFCAGVVANRIQFVVSHDRARTARVDHSADDRDAFDLPRATVDQIAEEQGDAPLRVAVCSTLDPVAQLAEERDQFAVVPMHIADDVVSHCYPNQLVVAHN